MAEAGGWARPELGTSGDSGEFVNCLRTMRVSMRWVGVTVVEDEVPAVCVCATSMRHAARRSELQLDA